MSYLSIRDLQKISGESIAALPGPTAVKSGEKTVGLLIPLKPSDPERVAEILAWAEELAKRRDRSEDEAFLAANPDVDPNNWSVEAVRALLRERG